MTQKNFSAQIDPRIKLSLLWIFVVLNMAYADILSLMDPTSAIRTVMAGASMPAGGLLAGALLMGSAVAMVVLSWSLPYKVNRWVTLVIGLFNILFVVRGGHGLYYLFFAGIEVLCMALIIWFAWKWNSMIEQDHSLE